MMSFSEEKNATPAPLSEQPIEKCAACKRSEVQLARVTCCFAIYCLACLNERMRRNDYRGCVVCGIQLGKGPQKRSRKSENEAWAVFEQLSKRIRTEPTQEFNPISLLVKRIEPGECKFCLKTGKVRELNCCNKNGCSNCIEESLKKNKCPGCDEKIYFNSYLPAVTPRINQEQMVPEQIEYKQENDASDYKEINKINYQALSVEGSTLLFKKVSASPEKIEKIITKRLVKMNVLRHSKWLGSGSFGDVKTTNYELLSPNADGTVNTMHVAAKIWSGNDDTSQYREMVFLQRLRHDNIVKYIAAVVDSVSKLCGYLMERHKTTLEEFVKNKDNKETMRYRFPWLVQLTDVVYFIHERGFILGDLKPQNIMISKENCVILIDFGTARQVASEMTTVIGTDSYMAPEVYEQAQKSYIGSYCQKADVFSYGLVLHFIQEGCNPIQEDPDRNDNNHLEIVKKHCEEFQRVKKFTLTDCIVAASTTFDPKKRITMKEIYDLVKQIK